jgi:hypothetical protein
MARDGLITSIEPTHREIHVVAKDISKRTDVTIK